MLKIIAISFAVLLSGCTSEKEIIRLDNTENFNFYYYAYEGNNEVLKKDKILLNKNADMEAAFDSINSRLSWYYSRDLDNAKIEFSLDKIEEIKTDSKNYLIAVINIKDEQENMEKKYFQGSTGGRTTQNTLLMNLIQPGVTDFIDAVIIHVNNMPVKELDHINLKGIKVP